MNTRTNNSIHKTTQRIGLMALPGLIALSIMPVQAQNLSPKPSHASCTTPATTIRTAQDSYVYVLRRGAVYQLRSSDLSLVSRKPEAKSNLPLEACFVSQNGSPVEAPVESGAKIDSRSASDTGGRDRKVLLDTSIDAKRYGGSANTPADNPGTTENNFTGGQTMPLRGRDRRAGMVEGNIPVITWSTGSPSRGRSEAAQSDTASYVYMLRGSRLYQYRANSLFFIAFLTSSKLVVNF